MAQLREDMEEAETAGDGARAQELRVLVQTLSGAPPGSKEAKKQQKAQQKARRAAQKAEKAAAAKAAKARKKEEKAQAKAAKAKERELAAMTANAEAEAEAAAQAADKQAQLPDRGDVVSEDTATTDFNSEHAGSPATEADGREGGRPSALDEPLSDTTDFNSRASAFDQELDEDADDLALPQTERSGPELDVDEADFVLEDDSQLPAVPAREEETELPTDFSGATASLLALERSATEPGTPVTQQGGGTILRDDEATTTAAADELANAPEQSKLTEATPAPLAQSLDPVMANQLLELGLAHLCAEFFPRLRQELEVAKVSHKRSGGRFGRKEVDSVVGFELADAERWIVAWLQSRHPAVPEASCQGLASRLCAKLHSTKEICWVRELPQFAVSQARKKQPGGTWGDFCIFSEQWTPPPELAWARTRSDHHVAVDADTILEALSWAAPSTLPRAERTAAFDSLCRSQLPTLWDYSATTGLEPEALQVCHQSALLELQHHTVKLCGVRVAHSLLCNKESPLPPVMDVLRERLEVLATTTEGLFRIPYVAQHQL
eukprot:COSAG01_NODE_30_length_36127_cov_41.433234_28_plen_552_part_00